MKITDLARRLTPHLAVRLLIVGLVATAAGCGGAIRLLSPSAGANLARDKNKPLLYYFKAWDSTQHRNMIIDVFENPEVTAALADVITVELEYAFYLSIARKYEIPKPQWFVMCTPGGAMVRRLDGASRMPTAAGFLQWLKEAKSLAKPPRTSQPATAKEVKPGSQTK